MFRKDIENIYSYIIKCYLNEGYRINYPTMSGSQGEIAKIDLTNDKEVIRILLDSKTENYREHPVHKYMGLDYLAIIVGRNTDKLRGDSFSDIIWNQHLELISEIRFYKIGRRNDSFFGTKQEAIDAMCKNYERFDFRDLYSRDEIIFSDKAKEIILPWVKRQKKCKSVNVKQIDEVKKVIFYNRKNIEVHYYVKAKGQVFKIRWL